MSLKIVGTLIFTPFSSFLTSVRTSELSVPPNLLGSAPGAASSDVTMACTGPRPSRMASEHPDNAAAHATAAAHVRYVVLDIGLVLLQPGDLGGDEDEELAALILGDVPLEQPPEQRQPVEPGRAVLRRLLAADVDAADHRRLAVAHQHLRDRALGIDRRDAVDLAAEVRRLVGDLDAHNHR